MDIGMVGLGRMGEKLSRRLLLGGHRVVGVDPGAGVEGRLVGSGIAVAPSLVALAAMLMPPRVVWLMIPAGAPVDEALAELTPEFAEGDVVVDGGNSHYRDSMRRADALRKVGVGFVDCGTSGGVWGLTEGFGLMVGGESADVAVIEPILKTLAPAPDKGWGHVGPVGAGHFVKMAHNGIEYGLMQSYAEGFSVLAHKTEFNLDLHQVAQVWRYGSVVRSWLLDLAADALGDNAALAGVAPYVDDSGEGRWAVNEAIDLDVPTPVIAMALIERLRSRDVDSFAAKLVAALRNEFGGHGIRRE